MRKWKFATIATEDRIEIPALMPVKSGKLKFEINCELVKGRNSECWPAHSKAAALWHRSVSSLIQRGKVS